MVGVLFPVNCWFRGEGELQLRRHQLVEYVEVYFFQIWGCVHTYGLDDLLTILGGNGRGRGLERAA